MSPRAFVSVFFLWSCLAAALASDVDNLAGARIPVFDRSDAEFSRAIAKALEIVVVKLTGDSSSANSTAGRGVVGQAKRFIQQFGYERPLDQFGEVTGDLVLRVEFDLNALGNVMRERGLVVWGKERPDTLVWIIVEDLTGRRLLGSEDPGTLLDTVERRASYRGIPVLTPLLDITVDSQIAATFSEEELLEVLLVNSVPYGVESILIGHLRAVPPGLWETNWRIFVAEETFQWSQQGDIPELLVEEAIDSLADALGRRFAAPSLYALTGSVAVEVQAVDSADDYARAEKYLRSLDAVTAISVTRIAARSVFFDVTVQGGVEALTQSIAFGAVLLPADETASVYRLIPR
jgi:hypothetical protein